jgi:tetratricopeptide (TPR) repeat protein
MASSPSTTPDSSLYSHDADVPNRLHVPEIPDRLTAALAGRYALKREIGAGGMATVYLAQDLRHERDVAVKVLRPELAATLGPERFHREIQIAAKLQHPHILPLLDSGQADGFLYYVMPFVEGESLRERLTRVRELPTYEATRLLRDVADALSHAHARGVVHRDIKPENVMLSGRHALVTDFGVAKAVSEAKGNANLTTAGVALGTPSYMSPEQAAADPNVDHRADIYALGAMGYELLAGRPPFVGTTPQQILAMHVTQEPDPLSRYRPGVPPALEAVIMQCLSKRASDRWQNAEEVVERLESMGTPASGMTPTHTQPTRAVAMPSESYGHPLRVAGLFLVAAIAVLGAVYFLTIQLGLPDWVPWTALGLLVVGLPIMVTTGLVERRRAKLQATGMWSVSGETGLHRHVTWKKATRGGMLAFGTLAVLAAAYTAMRLLGIGPVGTLVASGKLAARDRMVIADFVNKTSDSTLGSSLSEAFRIDIAQSPVITVLTSGAQAGALIRMDRDPAQPLDPETARELALREGAKAVVAGEISSVGRSFVLTARLLSAADGAELLALRETAVDDGQILAALDRLSKSLRERVGESLRSIRSNEPLDEVTTSSLEALRLYTEGVQAANASDNERAADLLRQAVAIDSGFAMAWRKLAVVLSNSFASPTEQLAAVTKAYQNRSRLPELERQVTIAYYYNAVDVDEAREVAAYRAALELDPDNNIALNNLGLIYERQRNYAGAESLFVHARRVNPGALVHYFGIARTLTRAGKVEEARAVLAEMAQQFPDNPDALRTLAVFQAVNGDWDSAQRAFTRLQVGTRSLENRAFNSFFLAGVDRAQGKLAMAEQATRDNIAVSDQRQLPGSALAGEVRLAIQQGVFTGDTTRALATLEDALQRRPLAGMGALERPYAEVASAYALLGRPSRARQLLKEYESAVPEGIRRGDVFRLAAEGFTAMAEGNYREAVSSFQGWYDESGCNNCALFNMGRAYELAGKQDSALAMYERVASAPRELFATEDLSWTLAPTYRRLGELYEERGEREKALEAYGKFTTLWAQADPSLQPQVREVKARMAKLAGEGR